MTRSKNNKMWDMVISTMVIIGGIVVFIPFLYMFFFLYADTGGGI